MKSFIEINFNNSFNRGSSSSKIGPSLEEVQVISASGSSVTGGNVSNSLEASQIKQSNWLHDIVVGAIGTTVGAIVMYIFGI